MKRLVEFRSYKGRGRARAFPARAGYLFPHPAYADLADRNAQQDAFYNSPDWVNGPRSAIVPLVVSYLNTLVWMSQESIDDLRKQNAGT